MPLVEFKSEFKQENPYEYPRLSLEKNERARILLIEERPIVEYVHNLRAPQLNNGVLVTEMAKDRDGNEREVPKYDFLARVICLGDESIMYTKGADVDGCPACRAASESSAVWKAEPRYGVHVIRYALKPGSFDVAEPFSVSLIAWTFSPKVFNTIVDLAEQWGDLTKHDLLLGPCQSKQYQKFDIAIAPTAEWMGDKERKALVVSTYKENKSEDLSILIGRRATPEQIQEHIDTILSRTAIAFPSKGGESLIEKKAAKEEVTPEALGLDKMEPAVEEAKPDEAEEATTSTDDESLDDLLSDLI